jgi:hypothetical protein
LGKKQLWFSPREYQREKTIIGSGAKNNLWNSKTIIDAKICGIQRNSW